MGVQQYLDDIKDDIVWEKAADLAAKILKRLGYKDDHSYYQQHHEQVIEVLLGSDE